MKLGYNISVSIMLAIIIVHLKRNMSLFFGKTIFKTIIFRMEFCFLQNRTTKAMIYCYPSIIIIIITMITLKGLTSNTEMKLLEIGYFKLQCVSVNTSHSTFPSNKSKTHLHILLILKYWK